MRLEDIETYCLQKDFPDTLALAGIYGRYFRQIISIESFLQAVNSKMDWYDCGLCHNFIDYCNCDE